MSKVIDIVPHLKTVAKNSEYNFDAQPTADQVFDFDTEKKKLLFHERRQVKRTILSEFMSAMVVLPELGLLKVGLFDISEEGISFETEEGAGQFKIGEQLLMRVYLNQKTYFPIQVSVKHATFDVKSGLTRHGTEFVIGASNDVALQHLVKFVESASSGLKKDDGDLMFTRTS